MPGLKLALLGAPRLERDGNPIEFDTRKDIAIVAYLAMTGASHSRETLITLLWPELDPSRARAGLRRNLSVLKKALGDWLVVERETVGPNPDADLWLDVAQFHRLLAAWKEHGHGASADCPACLRALAEAVVLYRGDFMAGLSLRDSVSFDEWQFFQAEGLRQELATALERLVRSYSDQGVHESAIPYARRWLALDPLHEPAHRWLMQLYARAGQRAAALRQYRECVRLLDAELGLEPDEETTRLYEQIRCGAAEREEPRAPVARPRHNLPLQTTPFIGRAAELAEIAARLDDPACRLLTLVGPGGAGKTRLALEAAAAQLDRYTHGVHFVPLAALHSAEAIAPAIAEALGFSFSARAETSPRQQLLNSLRHKSVLLVLDNLEHLLDGVDLATEVLATAPGVKLLITSRVRLNVLGEHLLPLAGMEFPDRETLDPLQYDAVRLFVQSARRVHPGFELQAGDLKTVARICRLVDGMPLGILLAAAWAEVLSPREIAAEIGKSLDFMVTDLRDVPERQRSIRAVFDHSWNLLTERERQVFQALSVFRGGLTREAAEQVAGASLRDLKRLVDHSLLHRTPAGRYEMHELLRQCAAERLAQSPDFQEVRDRHCACYAAALLKWEAELKGPRQHEAAAEIETDAENVRTAWRWAVERGQIAWLDQAVDGMCRFHLWRMRCQEGDELCRAAAERLATAIPGESAAEQAERLRVRAKILSWQGIINDAVNQVEPASQLVQQSLDLLEELGIAGWDVRAEKAVALLHLGFATRDADQWEEAGRLYEQSLDLYKELGDRWGTANALNALGYVAGFFGDSAGVKQLHGESLAIRRALGDRKGIADSLLGLGGAAMSEGRLDEAEQMLRESNTIHWEIGDWRLAAGGVMALGDVLFLRARFADACPPLVKAAATCEELGWSDDVVVFDAYRGVLQLMLGQYEQAEALGQDCRQRARAGGYQNELGFALLVLGGAALAREAHARAQDALLECVAVWPHTWPESLLARSRASLAAALCGLGQLDQARQRLCEALQMATESGNQFIIADVLPAVALFLLDRGEKERAVELYALASRYPFVAQSRWFDDVFGRRIAAADLPAGVVAAARERGQARDPRAVAVALLAELADPGA